MGKLFGQRRDDWSIVDVEVGFVKRELCLA
jgi:hypothetical protein